MKEGAGEVPGDGDALLFQAAGVMVSMVLGLSLSPGLQTGREWEDLQSLARAKLTLEPQRGGEDSSGLQPAGV